MGMYSTCCNCATLQHLFGIFPPSTSHFFSTSYRFGLTRVHGVNLQGDTNGSHLHTLCMQPPSNMGISSCFPCLGHLPACLLTYSTLNLNNVKATGLIYIQRWKEEHSVAQILLMEIRSAHYQWKNNWVSCKLWPSEYSKVFTNRRRLSDRLCTHH